MLTTWEVQYQLHVHKTVFQSKVYHPRMCVFSYARVTSSSCDLDLDPMSLVYELGLDIPKM